MGIAYSALLAPLALLGALSLHGCDAGGEPAASDVTVRDSAGVTIIENPAPGPTEDLLASPEPALEIGLLEGAPEYQFFRISDVTRLSDGGIVVADGGAREVRIFGPDGAHRVTVGGAGQGPSEFRYPAGLTVLEGDAVEVQDFLDRVRFGPDGTFLERITTDPGKLTALWGEGGMSEGGEWVPGGTLFAPVYHWDQSPPVAGPPFRPQMTLVRVTADLTRVDTLGRFGGIQQQYVDVGGERGPSATVPPFYTNTSWAVGADDGTIVVADNAHPQVHLFASDGGHVIVRWRAAAERVTSAEVDAWFERQRNESWAQSRLPDLERRWAAMDIPEWKPHHYGRVALGRDGSVWLMISDDLADTSEFIVMGRDGRWRGVVRVPGRFTVRDAGDGWMVGVYLDENDVEYVRLYELAG